MQTKALPLDDNRAEDTHAPRYDSIPDLASTAPAAGAVNPVGANVSAPQPDQSAFLVLTPDLPKDKPFSDIKKTTD